MTYCTHNLIKGVSFIIALLPVKTELKPSTLKHVIPSDGRLVVGLTFINNELIVLRDPSKQEIQVCETATYTQRRTVRVAGLRDDDYDWNKTLTSYDATNCLFLCDLYSVHKVDLSTDNVINWRVDGEPVDCQSTMHVML